MNCSSTTGAKQSLLTPKSGPSVGDSLSRVSLAELRELDRPYANYTYGTWLVKTTSGAWMSADDEWLSQALDHDFGDRSLISTAEAVVGDVSELAQRHMTVLCELCNLVPDRTTFTNLPARPAA